MSMTRRNFLLSAGCTAVVCTAFPSTGNASDPAQDAYNPYDWRSVRAQFNLSPDYIHLTGFYIVSHPRPVRIHDRYVKPSHDTAKRSMKIHF